ncbi:MAG: phosphoribosyltransferase family protein [Actinobacteria bacterium]|nr:phosphoribosyltransferase family protein [Actinomycetota bacterium]
MPILSSVQYSRTASRILLASKEDGIVEADDFVIAALVNSLKNTREMLGDLPHLVPIPSSSRANRRRGRNYISHLTQILSRSQGIQIRDVLFHQRKVVDQSTLSGAGRTENLTGAMSTKAGSVFFRPVVLVDDLVTTGSTLSEGIRALESAGYTVVAGITAFLAQPLR